jgi:hypothetical protein
MNYTFVRFLLSFDDKLTGFWAFPTFPQMLKAISFYTSLPPEEYIISTET